MSAIGPDNDLSTPASNAYLLEQPVGQTTVYFRTSGPALSIASSDELRAVAKISFPVDAIGHAGRIAREALKTVISEFENVERDLQGADLAVELTFSFEVTGHAAIVPVLLTGETSATGGLKITATWPHTLARGRAS
jgi:hypothetical protein